MRRFVAVLIFLLVALPGYAGTTYYVRPTNGSDSNAGTSFAAAFQTTQKALDTAAGGDEIRLCAEAVETPTATVDIDGTYTDVSAPLFITGANSTDGSVDGTIYTLSGSLLGAGSDLVSVGADADYVIVHNVRFTAAKRYNLHIGAAILRWVFNRCRFDSAVSHGLYSTQSSATYITVLVDCEIDSNGGWGASVNARSARGFGTWIRCSIHDNTSGGIQDGKYHLYVLHCLIYGNGGSGLNCSEGDGFGYVVHICGNTFFNNSSHGIDLKANEPAMIYNNVFRTNGGYAIYTNSGAIAANHINEDYNCFHGNVSGALDVGSIGANSITSDPKFTSETDGAEDFTPQAGSPLLGAGIDGGQW